MSWFKRKLAPEPEPELYPVVYLPDGKEFDGDKPMRPFRHVSVRDGHLVFRTINGGPICGVYAPGTWGAYVAHVDKDDDA